MRETVEIRTGTVRKFVGAIALVALVFGGVSGYRFERAFAADYKRLSVEHAAMLKEHTLVLQFLAAPIAHVGDQALTRAAVLEAVANERLVALQAEADAAKVTKAAQKGK